MEKDRQNLGVLGFTEHSVGHAMKVSATAALILEDKTDVRDKDYAAANSELHVDRKKKKRIFSWTMPSAPCWMT